MCHAATFESQLQKCMYGSETNFLYTGTAAVLLFHSAHISQALHLFITFFPRLFSIVWQL
jgi:hypothetical protein